MNTSLPDHQPHAGGIRLHAGSPTAQQTERQQLQAYLDTLDLLRYVAIVPDPASFAEHVVIAEPWATQWAPEYDTTALCEHLNLDPRQQDDDLAREILVSLLLSPVPFPFPSHDELVSAVRIRQNVVRAAHQTALAFGTTEAERPADCWTYAEATGFTILPGAPLIDALRKATQPDTSGALYAFSCYRATEYVTLLGVAQELADTHPALFTRLQRQWETRAIMSGQFHEVFLREYGTMEQPLPARYYVPGDRLWFRNPDEPSSNVQGYEGSWVIYLGEGLFTNFWKRDQPYTLTAKCVELYHWRHALRTAPDGVQMIDEAIVEARVQSTMQDAEAVSRILRDMLRLRDPSGVYRDGGCIDATRECVRWVRPGTADLTLPTL
jgi:hypothetical protein